MRRQPVDATKIRKATRRPKVAVLPMEEDFVESSVGYSTQPTDTPGFSMYGEYLAPSCVGPKVMHPKKTRVYRVLSGEGRLFKYGEEDTSIEKMTIGNAYVCGPGVPFQVSSSGTNHVEFLVVEDSKYSARLTTLEQEFSPENVKLPEAMGVGPDVFTVDKADKKRFSEKSARAQQARAAKRVSGGGVSAPSPLPSGFVPEGLNARPSMGKFSD